MNCIFFSSRRRHTRSLCDWSSDVCSSDLIFRDKLWARRCIIMEMVDRRAILRFVDRVAELFKPDKIIVFGSYARGTPTPDSDVDVLVVKNHRGPGHLLASKIRLAIHAGFPMDLL